MLTPALKKQIKTPREDKSPEIKNLGLEHQIELLQQTFSIHQ